MHAIILLQVIFIAGGFSDATYIGHPCRTATACTSIKTCLGKLAFGIHTTSSEKPSLKTTNLVQIATISLCSVRYVSAKIVSKRRWE
jgi:hypothetical protein